MGVTYVAATLRGPTNDEAQLPLLVDSGSQYTVLPRKVWQRLKLKPKRKARFSLADGTVVEREVSECDITLPMGDGHRPVVLGHAGDAPLLGAVTLAERGLMLNPFNRKLQPMRLMM